MIHKKWNKLMHITHGNTIELVSMNLAGAVIPLQGAVVEAAGKGDAKLESLEAFISMRRRPALLALQGCAGGWAEMQMLADRLRQMGYDCEFEPGEVVESGHDRHRRGGVLLGWQQSEFRVAVGRPRTVSGEEAEWAKGRRVAVLLQEAYVTEAEEAGEITEHVAREMRKYVGRRAMAVRLVRRRGPKANSERLHAVAYVPASASDGVKAAFISAVGWSIARASADGTPFTLAGDWQASPSPEWRVNQRANKAHDNALRDAFFGSGGEDELEQAAGVVVPLHLNPLRGEYSHHSAQGWHATIDHVFTDKASLNTTRGAEGIPPFLGSRGEGYDEHSLFDHRALVVELQEGAVVTLGRQRPKAERLRGKPSEIREFLQRLPTEVGLDDYDDVALGKLESQIAAAVQEVRRLHQARPDVGRRRAPDSEEVQLKYLQGLYDLVLQAYADCSESWGRGLFGARDSNHLYHDSMLRKARDRQLKRAGRRKWWAIDWKVMRDACEHALRNAITGLEPQVRRRRREAAGAADLGIGAAHSAESFARMLQAKQRAIKSGERAAGFSLTAVKNGAGEVVNTPEEVHKVAHLYGTAQNRVSRCDEALMRGWLDAFVPKGEALTLPGGKSWTFRDAVPYPVFCREMRRAKPGKAVALHPFLIDHLQCIPDEHPTLKLYYELFVRCMEKGRFPSHYRELVACLIPKTYGDVFELGSLRDIWLINHGSKLAERFLLHMAIAPVNANVLLCHAGGCKGRGCVDLAFALHATIADAIATKRNLYVLYVDLIKCFMSFSRSAGRRVAAHAGLPQTVTRAMKGLVDCAVHGTATGQYLTAFGTTDPFVILRGFLQGALASPEMCKLMMNTLAEALEMKVVGYELFDPQGRGECITQLVFVDDAANVTASAHMMQRVALFWSVWLRVTDTQANIAKLKKTVMSGLVWKTKMDGTKVPTSTNAQVFIGGLNPGDPPRRVPCLKIREKYSYVGMPTRLDGAHNPLGLALLKSKISNGAVQASSRPTSRCTALATANCYTLGSSFFYGAVFGGDAGHVELVLGPAARRACRVGNVRGRRRAISSPAVQLHAPAKPMTERKNDPMSARAASMSRGLAGYGVAHPYPAMAASSAMTFVNNLGAPLPTPSNLAALSSLARVLQEFGCRADPCEFYFDNLMDVLDQSEIIERAVWLICKLNGGRLSLEANFREGSAMHDDRWPGYPQGWVDLWKGPLWRRLKEACPGLAVSRLLMRAGISELANVCTRDGTAFMMWSLVQQMAPHVLEESPAKARRDFQALKDALMAAEVEPVRGRQPWAVADAGECLRPSLDVPGEEDDGGLLREDAQAREDKERRVEDVSSGDGGAALARMVGLSGRPEWEGDEEGQGAVPAEEDTAGSSADDKGGDRVHLGRGGRRAEEGDGRADHRGDRVHLGRPDREEDGSSNEAAPMEEEEAASLNGHAREVRAHPGQAEDREEEGGDANDPGGDRVHPGQRGGERLRRTRRHGRARRGPTSAIAYGARVAEEVYHSSIALRTTFPIAPFGYGMMDMATGGSWKGVEEATAEAEAAHPMICAGAVGRDPGEDLSVASRVLRATDAFGVLDVPLDDGGRPPSDAEVAQAFEDVRDALQHQAGVDVARWGETTARTRCAAACVNAAMVDLADRDQRATEYFAALERSKSVVAETRCPVDARGLRAFAEAGEGRDDVHAGTGLTLGLLALELAAEVGVADEEGVAWVPLRYRHSFVGARLIAGGHLTHSRVYAVERYDPFSRPRAVRAAALARFGFDFDDKSAYPTVMLAIFVEGRLVSGRYLRHKEEVLQSLARHFFGNSDAVGRGAVKQLFNAMDMGGGPGAWLEDHGEAVCGDPEIGDAVARVANGDEVSVIAYRKAQEARAEELVKRAPRLVEAVRGLNAKRGPGRRAELTAMSYLLQHYEGASREAKREWLRARGCAAYSLQHDGLMATLVRGVTPEAVAEGLSAAASEAAGMEVKVEVKSAPSGDDSFAYGARPPCRHRPSHALGAPSEGESSEEEGGGEEMVEAFARAVGTSKRREAPRLVLPGPDQLTVDGGTRRIVLSYKKDLPVAEREWAQRTVGGFHIQWAGRGAEWLRWARESYRFEAGGRLVGYRTHVQCPLAAIFWWECDRIARGGGKDVNVEESSFVFDKMLELEASYPITHFVASDGSRKERDRDNPETKVGRALVSVCRQGVKVLGGRMEPETRGFDRHSYEAEIQAFLDHLADTADTVTVFITDCLSGSQAGSKFKSRTDAHKSGCYRGVELDNVDALETRHRAIIYLWVHSHVGIVPNEAADVLADMKREGDEWNEMLVVPSRFQLARVRGVKRGIGQAVYEMAQGLILNELADRVQYTMLPGRGTWALAVRAPHKAGLLREADFNLLADARANRCGLMADRSLEDPAPCPPPASAEEAWKRREYRPGRATWEWYRQVVCECPGCRPRVDPEAHCSDMYPISGSGTEGRVAQTRWHVLAECGRGEEGGVMDGLRERAAAWLVGRAKGFDSDAQVALKALQEGGQGLSRGQRWMAMRFMLGVPMEPPDEEDVKDSGLAVAYAKGFLVHMCALLREGGRKAERGRCGAQKPDSR